MALAAGDESSTPATDLPSNPTCAVVHGRRSAVGRALVPLLLRSGDWTVRVVDSEADEAPIAPDAAETRRVEVVRVDFGERSQVVGAIKGSRVVFLMDIAESSMKNFYDCYVSIVQGTKNMINICQECKVERLVYNSSADVVFDGIHSITDGNESLTYPLKFHDMFNDLRAQAEATILFANGKHGLLTCALRPSNTFGPRDVHLVKLFVDEAKSGRLKFIVGRDKTMVDFTYVENVAHAHVLAERALSSSVSSVAGKPFFITNLEPVELWEFMASILESLGYQRPVIHLPAKFVLFVVTIMEWVFGKIGVQRSAQSFFTYTMIHKLLCTRTFDCSKAQKTLGYSPIVFIKEGIMSTTESFSSLLQEELLSRECDPSPSSKVNKLLGGGTVAEVLLWRDEKKTSSYLLGLFFLFYWFFLSGRTTITSAAKLLLLANMLLFAFASLPSSIFGLTIEALSPSCFKISEASIKGIFTYSGYVWNQGFCILMSIAQGNDWQLLFKTAGTMYLITLVVRFSLTTLVAVGLIGVFSVFLVYEQHEAEIDRIIMASIRYAKKAGNAASKKLTGLLAQYNIL